MWALTEGVRDSKFEVVDHHIASNKQFMNLII